jgi:dynein heavy chain
MTKQMEMEQEAFEEELDGLISTVGDFHKNNKMDKYIEIAKEVESYDNKINQLIEQARVYNTREFIVGKEQKDYSRLQKMAKDFQPYSNLWKTTMTWKTQYNEWMTGKWENLKAEELVNTFEQCLKNMSQCVRFFS